MQINYVTCQPLDNKAPLSGHGQGHVAHF